MFRQSNTFQAVCFVAKGVARWKPVVDRGQVTFCVRQRRRLVSFTLDYDQWIHLDAEDLAENGIAEAYERLLPELRKLIPHPAAIEELVDNDAPLYSACCGGKCYAIYAPNLDDEAGDSWWRATVAFFGIVNEQLAGVAFRFYAVNGGNDLGGMFLIPTQAIEARTALPDQRDWPYLPANEPPWYGRHH